MNPACLLASTYLLERLHGISDCFFYQIRTARGTLPRGVTPLTLRTLVSKLFVKLEYLYRSSSSSMMRVSDVQKCAMELRACMEKLDMCMVHLYNNNEEERVRIVKNYTTRSLGMSPSLAHKVTKYMFCDIVRFRNTKWTVHEYDMFDDSIKSAFCGFELLNRVAYIIRNRIFSYL